MEIFDLNKVRKNNIMDLSGGQKKRVQVAREFLHDMDLLFLDERTVGMDPIVRRKLLDYIKMRAKNGLTVLFTTHIMEEADYLCDRIGIINSGKMIIEGNSGYLKENFGGYKTLKLDLNGDIDDLTKNELISMNVNLKNENNKLLITAKNIDNIIPEIIKTVEKHGYNIIKLNMDQSSLEDVFFEVVN